MYMNTTRAHSRPMPSGSRNFKKHRSVQNRLLEEAEANPILGERFLAGCVLCDATNTELWRGSRAFVEYAAEDEYDELVAAGMVCWAHRRNEHGEAYRYLPGVRLVEPTVVRVFVASRTVCPCGRLSHEEHNGTAVDCDVECVSRLRVREWYEYMRETFDWRIRELWLITPSGSFGRLLRDAEAARIAKLQVVERPTQRRGLWIQCAPIAEPEKCPETVQERPREVEKFVVKLPSRKGKIEVSIPSEVTSSSDTADDRFWCGPRRFEHLRLGAIAKELSADATRLLGLWASRPTERTPGYCWLAIFPRVLHAELAPQLGPFPTFDQVGRCQFIFRDFFPLWARLSESGVHLATSPCPGSEKMSVGRIRAFATAHKSARVGASLAEEDAVRELDKVLLTEEIAEEEEDSILVGGDNDCWRAAFDIDPGEQIDHTRGFKEFNMLIEAGIEDALGPRCHELEDSRDERSPFDRMCAEIRIEFTIMDQKRLHLVGFEMPQMEPDSPEEVWLDSFRESPAYVDSRYLSLHGGRSRGKWGFDWLKYMSESISKVKERWESYDPCYLSFAQWKARVPGMLKSKALEERVDEEILENSDDAVDDVVIGSAAAMVDEAKRVGAVDLAKAQASEAYIADWNSLPKTRYRMTDQEKRQFAAYVGYAVESTMSAASNSDHKFLMIARNFCRDFLLRTHQHQFDRTRSLHVGCTVHELSTWESHLGHDFLLNMVEDKDNSRIFDQLLQYTSKKLAAHSPKSLRTGKGSAVQISMNSVEEALDLVGKLSPSGRRRSFFKLPDTRYDVLFFEDCLYSMTDKQFAWYWNKAGASVAYAVLFAPDAMVSKDSAVSSIYHYDEYFTVIEDVDSVVSALWPSILIFTPLMPLGDVAAAVEKLLRYCLGTGWELFKSRLLGAVFDRYPLEAVFGLSLDALKVGPIAAQILDHVLPLVKKTLMRVRLRFKGGFSNGYDHTYGTWHNWIHNRRIDLGDGTYADSEIVERVGEMWVIKYWRSNANDPIVSSLTIPISRQIVKVADIENAWNVSESKLDDLTYFNVEATTWWKVLNWGIAEDMASLNFSVMVTMVNRTRGGLSLASNVLVEPMNMQDNEVSKIALAVLLEIYKRKNVLEEIENNTELATGYTTNLVRLIATVAKVGLTIATGGLSVPIYFLLKWLMAARPDYEFVKYVEEPKARIVKPVWSPFKKKPLKTSFEMVMPTVAIEKAQPTGCFLCDLRNAGLFSRDGVPENGQAFICSHVPLEKQDLSYGPEEANETAHMVRDAKIEHQGMGAAKLVPLIGKLEHFFEMNASGIKHEARIHYILGGPGTGKTEIIKSLVMAFSASGVVATVMLPFSKLAKDYTNASIMRRAGVHDISADTTWYTIQRGSAQVLIVDEASASRWAVIKAMAVFLSVQDIYLVGDEHQTMLNKQANEGFCPFDEASKIDWAKVPKHELVWNYRLDAWRTKMLNKQFGYRMIARRKDKQVPEFMTKEAYALVKATAKLESEFVFGHDSAMAVFGVQSSSKDSTVENMSVRSSQGLTVASCAVSASELDRNIINVQGMALVAVSRAKGRTIFVCPESCDDHVPMELKKMFLMTTAADVEGVWDHSWPRIDDTEPTVVVETRQDVEIEEFLAAKKKDGKFNIMADADYDELIWDAKEQEVEVPLGIEEPVVLEMDYLQSRFEMCFHTAIAKQNVEAADRHKDWLIRMDADDGKMGRAQDVGMFSRWWSDGGTVWPKYGNKTLVDMNAAIADLEDGDYWVVLLNAGVVEYCTPNSHRRTSKPIVIGRSGRSHVVAVKAPMVDVVYKNTKMVTSLSLLDVVAGEFVFETETTKVVLNEGTDRWKTVQCHVVKNAISVVSAAHDSMIDFALSKAAVALARESLKNPLTVGSKPTNAGKQPELANCGKACTFKKHVFPCSSILLKGKNIRTDAEFAACFVGSGSLSKMVFPDISRAHERRYFSHVEPYSCWKLPEEKPPTGFHVGKYRSGGVDFFRLSSLVDPSVAWSRSSALNDIGPNIGPTTPVNVKLNWEGFLFDRTASGKLKRRVDKQFFSGHVGMGNRFGDSPEEALVASERYSSRRQKPRLNAETKRYAYEVAERCFRENFLPRYNADPERMNAVIERGLRDGVARNYHGRADVEIAKTFGKKTLSFHLKSQFKPIKSDKLNLLKGGQGILQSPPSFNQEFICWSRIMNFQIKDRAQDHYWLDDRENPSEFRKNLTRAILELPKSARFAILDAKTFDAQQNEVTLEIERQMLLLLGHKIPAVHEFYKIRGSLPYRMFGAFEGKTDGSKGSGFLDTKSGNTILETALAGMLFEGKGPKLIAAKGDDLTRVQSGVQVVEYERVRCKKFAGMEFDYTIGDGGEFLGCTISRAGMYSSVSRACMKAMAATARGYKHFCEQQSSYRETIKDYQRAGVIETIGYTAQAEGKSYDYVSLCFDVLNSLAHINEDQWKSWAKKRVAVRYDLPSASGVRLR